jgi:hypothetical protein
MRRVGPPELVALDRVGTSVVERQHAQGRASFVTQRVRPYAAGAGAQDHLEGGRSAKIGLRVMSSITTGRPVATAAAHAVGAGAASWAVPVPVRVGPGRNRRQASPNHSTSVDVDDSVRGRQYPIVVCRHQDRAALAVDLTQCRHNPLDVVVILIRWVRRAP